LQHIPFLLTWSTGLSINVYRPANDSVQKLPVIFVSEVFTARSG
jgi:hypothetical protein